MHSGESFNGEFTARETQNPSISSAGYGFSNADRAAGSVAPGSSHLASSSGSSMTGIRLWTGSRTLLGLVVTMVNE